MNEDVQLRILASGILYRACLRARAASASALAPEDKMALHARVEETAWQLAPEMLREVEGREVEDGVPSTEAWKALVARLAQGP